MAAERGNDLSPEAKSVFARSWQRVEALPDGKVKDALKENLIGMRLIIEILETLQPGDPFIDRCRAIARRILESPPAEHADEVRAELAVCVEIARSKMN